MTLLKKRGQITRRIDVPLCAECTNRLGRRSGEEERLIRLGRLAGSGMGIILALLVTWALPLDLWVLRLAAGVSAGLMVGALVYRALVKRAEAAELPERRVVREAAGIVDFNWREMTLAFADRNFAERVHEMNAAVVDNEALADVTALEVPAPPADELSV